MQRRIWADLVLNRYTSRWSIIYHDKHTQLGFYPGDGDYATQQEAALQAERQVLLSRIHHGDGKAEAVWDRIRRMRQAEERLQLARWALIQTGYFTPDQVGDDVAPRITEMFSALAPADE